MFGNGQILLQTWKLVGVPYDDCIVDTAGGEPAIVGRPGDVQHIYGKQRNMDISLNNTSTGKHLYSKSGIFYFAAR